jgi:hypothetical protein
MQKILTAGKATSSVGLVIVVFGLLHVCEPVGAGTLPPMGATEQVIWSDMAFPGNVTGGFDAGTMQLTASAFPSNDLEIGSVYGPGKPGRHYGTSGTLGGAFSATLNVSGVQVQSDGTVTNGGSVSITFGGGASGSLGTDYGIAAGASLLQGSVVDVQLDATGDNTLDVLFAISGGALQNVNPALGTNFSPSSWGLIRVGGSGVTLPSDFSESFSFNGGTIDVYGIPEPSSILLGLFGVTFVLVAVRKRRAR